MTEHGETKSSDISEFAFGQLCTRLGVPASYVKKCFDNGKINLDNTVDSNIYKPSQVYLSTDRLHIRFVNHEPLPIDNDGSPLYAGFTVDSSDVGRGSLNMKFFIYRSVYYL